MTFLSVSPRNRSLFHRQPTTARAALPQQFEIGNAHLPRRRPRAPEAVRRPVEFTLIKRRNLDLVFGSFQQGRLCRRLRPHRNEAGAEEKHEGERKPEDKG